MPEDRDIENGSINLLQVMDEYRAREIARRNNAPQQGREMVQRQRELGASGMTINEPITFAAPINYYRQLQDIEAQQVPPPETQNLEPLHATGCASCGTDNILPVGGPHTRFLECTQCRRGVCNTNACATVINGNQIICSSCRRGASRVCADCGVWTLSQYNVNGLICCKSCFAHAQQNKNCIQCRKILPKKEFHPKSDVCENCEALESHTQCISCLNMVLNKSIVEHYCNRAVCKKCLPGHVENVCSMDRRLNLKNHSKRLVAKLSSALTSPHASIAWEYKADKLDLESSPYFGIELEIQCGIGLDSDSSDRDEKVKDLRTPTNLTPLDLVALKIGLSLDGIAYICPDGSVSDGFEIVFTPHKLHAFKKLNISKILRELAGHGASSYNGNKCGMHIHLTRNKWFKTRRTYRGNTYSNAELYQLFFVMLQKEIFKFSKRTPDRIERYCKARISRSDRYCMVNLTNLKTVEVRVWRGTLHPDRFKAHILFTLCVIDFIKAHPIQILFGDNYKTLQNIFTDWLKTQGEYTFLLQYLTKHSLFGLGEKVAQESEEKSASATKAQTHLGDADAFHNYEYNINQARARSPRQGATPVGRLTRESFNQTHWEFIDPQPDDSEEIPF